jgi:phospholipid/cholesterol/gamma-HCH transport system substrate-binding protein
VNEEQRERNLKFRVGMFVLVAVVALLGMVYLLGARARLFEPRYVLHADFTEVGGLAEGATVRLAGVQIGRVTGVNLPSQPGGKVRIDMTIAKRYADRIRKDSTARIETQGLLGDKIIEITVGTAEAPPARAGDALAARDPFDIGRVMDQSAQVVKDVSALAAGLRETAETLNQSGIIEGAAETVATARTLTEQLGKEIGSAAAAARNVTDRVARIVERVERGPGMAHALLYDEPLALRRLNDLVTSTQALLERIERGEGAVGVLTSAESTAAAKRLVAAMDRLGGMVDRPQGDEGLLPSLLFDPKYRAVLDDLQVVSRNLRDVSDRIAGGRGTLGTLVKDEPEDGGIRAASRDLQAAMANLRSITEKIDEGEGTIGALIADPTIYERLVRILDGAQRSFLLRGLLRGLGKDGKDGEDRGRDQRGSGAPR